jgi:hypothetical protein
MIESNIGKGKVVLFVSSIDRDWNNFSIQPTFLPWIQRWIKYSARGLDSLTHKELLVGQSFNWKLFQKNNKAYIVTPEGKIITPPTVDGEITFKDTYTPGIYQLYLNSRVSNIESKILSPSRLPSGAEPAGAFTVNIDTTESSPIKITDVEINNLLPKAKVVFSSGHQKSTLSKRNKGISLFTYCMMLAGAMLLIEGWLVRKE